MDLITMIFWTALSIALGYPVNGQEAIRGLPCIQRLHQLYCRNQGSQYPEDRIEMFIDLNKALTRRMFGEYQPPGELFEEVPAFPNIQQFETIDFPEYLRPAGWRRAGSAFEQVPAPPADRRQTRRPPQLRPRARARANANASARASTTRAGATKRAMTKVRPTRVATRPPAKRLVTQTPVRPPFVNNVFLNQGAELLAAASQPAAHAGRRYPRRQAPANQRFGPRVKRSSNDTMASPPLRRRRRRQSVPPPPKIDKGSKHLVDSCESKIEIITPYWAANSAGEIRAIVNTKHFPQAIHQEICKGTTTSHCSGSCVCEQKYTYHRLLAYDPENDCKGIFIDWFLFPSCCACRCPP